MITAEMEKVLKYYNEALIQYKKRQFEAALKLFKQALEAKPDDGPSKLYIERCQHFMESPPPEDWDGVFTMTTK